MITLTFPFRLLSKDNEKIRNRQGRYFLSDKFRGFEEKVMWETRSQYRRKMLENDLSVRITAYFTNKKHPDCGNLSKSILDALQEIVYKNDRQIKKLEVLIVDEEALMDAFNIDIDIV